MSEQNEILNGEELAAAPETVEAIAPVVEEVVDASVAQPIVTPEEDEVEVYTEPAFDEGFLGTCERALYKAWKWIKKVLHLPDLTKKQRAELWDKITTGILIALFATPVLVLLYILLWFILK